MCVYLCASTHREQQKKNVYSRRWKNNIIRFCKKKKEKKLNKIQKRKKNNIKGKWVFVIFPVSLALRHTHTHTHTLAFYIYFFIIFIIFCFSFIYIWTPYKAKPTELNFPFFLFTKYLLNEREYNIYILHPWYKASWKICWQKYTENELNRRDSTTKVSCEITSKYTKTLELQRLQISCAPCLQSLAWRLIEIFNFALIWFGSGGWPKWFVLEIKLKVNKVH